MTDKFDESLVYTSEVEISFEVNLGKIKKF